LFVAVMGFMPAVRFCRWLLLPPPWPVTAAWEQQMRDDRARAGMLAVILALAIAAWIGGM
jgi:hypothetical protein